MHGVQGADVGPVGPGDTAILPDGSKSGGHLNIVLCEPVGLDDKVILVNVITYRKRWQDSTTVLKKGEHSRIRETSIVYYENATLVRMRDVEKLFATNTRAEKLRPNVFERVIKGLEESPHTPPEVLDLYREAAETKD